MPTDPSSDPLSSAKPVPASQGTPSSLDISPGDTLEEAMKKLTAQAAFLQAFAENVAEEERPIEEVAPKARGGEIDFGWRAGLSW